MQFLSTQYRFLNSWIAFIAVAKEGRLALNRQSNSTRADSPPPSTHIHVDNNISSAPDLMTWGFLKTQSSDTLRARTVSSSGFGLIVEKKPPVGQWVNDATRQYKVTVIVIVTCDIQRKASVIITVVSIDIAQNTCHRYDRTDGRRGGGVVCYIRSRWPCTIQTYWRRVTWSPITPCCCCCCCCCWDGPTRRAKYRSITTVGTIISQHPHTGLIIVGDFNTLDDRSIRVIH